MRPWLHAGLEVPAGGEGERETAVCASVGSRSTRWCLFIECTHTACPSFLLSPFPLYKFSFPPTPHPQRNVAPLPTPIACRHLSASERHPPAPSPSSARSCSHLCTPPHLPFCPIASAPLAPPPCSPSFTPSAGPFPDSSQMHAVLGPRPRSLSFRRLRRGSARLAPPSGSLPFLPAWGLCGSRFARTDPSHVTQF